MLKSRARLLGYSKKPLPNAAAGEDAPAPHERHARQRGGSAAQITSSEAIEGSHSCKRRHTVQEDSSEPKCRCKGFCHRLTATVSLYQKGGSQPKCRRKRNTSAPHGHASAQAEWCKSATDRRFTTTTHKGGHWIATAHKGSCWIAASEQGSKR